MQFSAKIDIIGINPYVPVPLSVLRALFKQYGKERGPIPVQGTIDGKQFKQTLVKFSGAWRLYVNGEMCKAVSVEVGDKVNITLAFDPVSRLIPMHESLGTALDKHELRSVFGSLPPHRKKEILRYMHSLKSQEAIDRRVAFVIKYLSEHSREGMYDWLGIKEDKEEQNKKE